MISKYFMVDCHLHGVMRDPEQGWKARNREDMYDLLGGTLDEIIRYLDELGIAQTWCLPAWPGYGMRLGFESKLPKDLNPSEREKSKEDIRETLRGRLERLNLSNCMAAKSYPNRLAAFITIDPYFGSDWMVKQVEDMVKNHGAKGIKMLPDWNHFFPNDRTLWPAYKKMEELGVVLLSHSGGGTGTLWDKEDTTTKGYTWPTNYADVLHDFPKLMVVLAHLGLRFRGGRGEEPKAHLELAQRFPNVYFDTSSAQEIRVNIELIRQVGVDRVLWGSDWAAHRHSMGLVTMLRSGLLEEEKRKILGENAQRLIKL